MSQADERVVDYPIPAPNALEPPQEWAELRAHCPVARAKLPSGDEVALLTRYADVKAVLSNNRFDRRLDKPDAARLSNTDSGGVFNSEMSSALPKGDEAHLRWRRLLNRWFTVKRMNALRPEIASIAAGLIDDMTASGQPADLKAHLGFPLPVWVICNMLGVPTDDRFQFSHWSDVFLNLTKFTSAEVKQAEQDFFRYMHDHISVKREQPGDDLLSELIVASAEDDEPMGDKQLAATGLALLIAGHETTANMIGKMVAMLLADRSRWEALLADRSLIRNAVEECLRLDANSGLGMVRYLGEDADLNGTVIPQGTTVMCSMAAANRDPEAFDNPEHMDLTRGANPHLAFGAGMHSCLGQALARTELHVTVEVLLEKLPTLELAVPVEELRRVEGLVVGGLREVPVRW